MVMDRGIGAGLTDYQGTAVCDINSWAYFLILLSPNTISMINNFTQIHEFKGVPLQLTTNVSIKNLFLKSHQFSLKFELQQLTDQDEPKYQKTESNLFYLSNL